jgi:ribose 5-phosphate isomerase B
MCIAANKLNGIRAALCHNSFYAYRARRHNDANVLCLGDMDNRDELKEIVISFLKEPFDGGRHQPRIDKIKALENKTAS